MMPYKHSNERNRNMAMLNMEGHSLREIASMYDLTTSRVQQIIAKELRIAIHRFANTYPHVFRWKMETYLKKRGCSFDRKNVRAAEMYMINSGYFRSDLTRIKDNERAFKYRLVLVYTCKLDDGTFWTSDTLKDVKTIREVLARKDFVKELYDTIGGFTTEEVI